MSRKYIENYDNNDATEYVPSDYDSFKDLSNGRTISTNNGEMTRQDILYAIMDKAIKNIKDKYPTNNGNFRTINGDDIMHELEAAADDTIWGLEAQENPYHTKKLFEYFLGGLSPDDDDDDYLNWAHNNDFTGGIDLIDAMSRHGIQFNNPGKWFTYAHNGWMRDGMSNEDKKKYMPVANKLNKNIIGVLADRII